MARLIVACTALLVAVSANAQSGSDQFGNSPVYFPALGAPAAPTFSVAPGTYAAPQSVALSAEPGTAIRYTTDGSKPTAKSMLYQGPITVSNNTTIQALAVPTSNCAPIATGIGYNCRPGGMIASASYNIQLASPGFRPPAGQYEGTQMVELYGPPGSTIRYTTDGSEPTASSTVYTAPFAVSSSTTVRARAFAPGMADSSAVMAKYDVTEPVRKVTLTVGKIDIKEKVYFDTNKDTIQQRSYGLLDNVAILINQNPQVGMIRIEGHTDSSGSKKLNQTLSQKRAEAVQAYLVKQGVQGSRLKAVGYGEDRPVASNKTKVGREQNRRVDFFVESADKI